MSPRNQTATTKRTTKSLSLSYEKDDDDVDSTLLPSLIKKGYRAFPILYVNGARVPAEAASKARPNQSLLSFLRDVLGLTGSKLGCGEGGCGACTVMVSKTKKTTTETGESVTIQHRSVNACLMPVLAADGCHVTTVEGVGRVKGDALHPVQRAVVEMHGSQCGTSLLLYLFSPLLPSFRYYRYLLSVVYCRCSCTVPYQHCACVRVCGVRSAFLPFRHRILRYLVYSISRSLSYIYESKKLAYLR